MIKIIIIINNTVIIIRTGWKCKASWQQVTLKRYSTFYGPIYRRDRRVKQNIPIWAYVWMMRIITIISRWTLTTINQTSK